jgi:hypothetical protein
LSVLFDAEGESVKRYASLLLAVNAVLGYALLVVAAFAVEPAPHTPRQIAFTTAVLSLIGAVILGLWIRMRRTERRLGTNV